MLSLFDAAGNDLDRVLANLDLRAVLVDDENASQGSSIVKALIWRLKLADLKALCKQHNLPHNGRSKEALVKRLAEKQKSCGDAEVNCLDLFILWLPSSPCGATSLCV